MTLGAKPFFWPFFTRTFLSLILLSHKNSPLVLALFQMADNGWIGGICHVEPGLPKLLILSLERIGVVDPPEFIYRESDDFLFVFNIVACVWIVILAIVALLCSLPYRVVR